MGFSSQIPNYYQIMLENKSQTHTLKFCGRCISHLYSQLAVAYSDPILAFDQPSLRYQGFKMLESCTITQFP